MNRTMRTAPLALIAVAAIALSGCGGAPEERQAAPSTGDSTSATAPVVAPSAAPVAEAVTSPKAAPTTKSTTKPTSKATTKPKRTTTEPADETKVVFALLAPDAADVKDDDLAVVSYDKLTYDGGCDTRLIVTEGRTDEQKFDECWSNSSNRTRTVVVDSKTDTTFSKGEPGEGEGVFPDELPIILGPEGQSLGRLPNDVSVWRIDIRNGHALRMTEMGNEQLSIADASWARLNL